MSTRHGSRPNIFQVILSYVWFRNTVELGYNDPELCHTTPITSQILWYSTNKLPTRNVSEEVTLYQ